MQVGLIVRDGPFLREVDPTLEVPDVAVVYILDLLEVGKDEEDHVDYKHY